MKYSHTIDNKKYIYSLDSEEEEILRDIEAGKYKTVNNIKEEIEKAREYAKNTISRYRTAQLRKR